MFQFKLEQKEATIEHLKQKSMKLEKNLENSKIFLNMVVHDLRNPTNQINFLIEQTLNILKDLMSGGYIFNK